MSSKDDFLKKTREEIKDLIKKGQEAEAEAEKVKKSITKASKMAVDSMSEVTKALDGIAKKIGVSSDAVAEVAQALVNLKVVPNLLSAITKHQDVLTKATKDYSAAISEGYEDAVKFFNANKKEYDEQRESNEKIIAGFEKRIAAGEKLTKTETKKLNLARKENQELVPLLDTYRKERKEIDAAAKAKERDAKASETKASKAKEAAEKGKKAAEAEIKISKDLTKSLENVLEEVNKIRTSINTAGGLKIHIENSGFTRVLNEMKDAIDRFHERAEGATPRKKNFFDRMMGTPEENKKSSDKLVKNTTDAVRQVQTEIISPLGTTLTEKISKAISKGFSQGIAAGVVEASNLNPNSLAVLNLAKENGLTPKQRRRLIDNMIGKVDVTEVEVARQHDEWAYKKYKYDRRTKYNTDVAKQKAELEFEYNVRPGSVKERIDAKAQKEAADAKLAELRYQKELNKEQREAVNRERNKREQIRIEKEMAEVYGEEGSKIQKLGEDLVLLQAKRREILIQGDELNKINFAELANNTRRIQDTTRKWATEIWNINHNTDKWVNRFKTLQNVFTRIASMTQTMSAAVSAAGGLWSNMRTAATSFFRYFTNGFRRAFSYVRNLATSTLQAGIEQRKKIEQAQIGFASFFGEDRVDAVTQRVRQEAMKTPIVDAGSLADYVQQLAPVSQGNASLAINASLGILKSLVYSGSDISEGEYVIKNIRDVIAKGKATAIDIRQFNRALPGLEQALRESGQDAFLDKEGKLNITSKNVGQVLDLFAKLNTDENSPLKEIEEKQLRTLSGLEQLLTEKKTSAMETILEKSGFFDLMYDVLGIATDSNKWDKITNFLGNTLQPIVGKITNIVESTDWDNLGKKLSDFFTPIGEGITEAKNLIFDALKDITGSNDMQGVMNSLSQLIKRFIIGFGQGTKDVIDFVHDITKRASGLFGGSFETLVENIGKFLISPLGKLIQMILGFTQNSLGMVSRVSAFIASLNKGLVDLTKKVAATYSTRFANNIVANTPVSQMTAAQLQTVMQGGTLVKQETAKAATETSSFAAKLKNAGSAVKTFGTRLLGAVSVGGTIWTASNMFASLAREMQLFGDASNNAADIIEVSGQTIAGTVAGSMIGGVTGGVVGALTGAAISLIELKVRAKEAAKAMAQVTVDENKKKASEIYRDKIIEAMQAQGIDVDLDSDAGKYMHDRLQKVIYDKDLTGMSVEDIVAWGANEAAWMLRYKKVAESIAAFDDTDAYQNAGGSVIDFSATENREKRHELGERVKYYRLLGDTYDYDNTSIERIVKDFLGNNRMTTGQYDLLMSKFSEYDDTFATSTTTIAEGLSDASTQTEAATEAIKDLDREITKLNNETIPALIDSGTIKPSDANAYSSPYGGTTNKFKLWDYLDRKNQIMPLDKATDITHTKVYDAVRTRQNELEKEMKKLDPESRQYKDYANELEEIKGILEKIKNANSWESIKSLYQQLVYKYSWFSKYFGKYTWANTGGAVASMSSVRPIYRATGGLGVDTVPAMLQPGEFIMRKSAVNKAGLSTMFALNRGDMVAAARSLGSRFNQSYNNSRNWNSVTNNNQKTQSNYFKIFNKNKSGRVASYYSMANRIALA